MTSSASIALPRLRWRATNGPESGERLAAEETPVAIIHQGGATAVMMATPMDLEDFAIGFTLSEGIAEELTDIQDLEVVRATLGVEVRIWLSAGSSGRLAARRRHMAGPTGCGLCGVESLEAAMKPVRQIIDVGPPIIAADLLHAMNSLEGAQPLGQSTRAVHAAALWRRGEALVVREDVGRHNALDKLIGATASTGGGKGGILLLTSRVSVEMVQKAAVLGAPILCAVSAPTALAVRTADEAGITLVGVARADGFEVFTHRQRVLIADALL
jgi:FdhD protein